ncbi:TolC family protein, partial [Mycobacterium tuberculosis]|nr:TolC family protein [Mycobacterium tuberculosis]
VAQAKSGYRPTVSIDADIGLTRAEGRTLGSRLGQVTRPGGAGITVNQTLFNGFRTDNQTRQAESDVLRVREALRATEMNTLFNAAQAY